MRASVKQCPHGEKSLNYAAEYEKEVLNASGPAHAANPVHRGKKGSWLSRP